MGAGVSTNQSKEDEDANTIEERESDESFQVIAHKFGYYDSSDSEISELNLPVNHTRKQLSKGGIKALDQSLLVEDEEKLGKEVIKNREEEIKRRREQRKKERERKRREAKQSGKDLTKVNVLEPTHESKTTQESEDTTCECKCPENQLSAFECTCCCKASSDSRSQVTSKENTSTEKGSNELKSSAQMSIERKRSSLDRQNSTRYSREPPERDQNYEDNLKDTCWSCRNEDCKRHQQYSPCCHYNSRKNICHNQFCSDRRPKTTYDIAKSAENLRQNDYNRFNNYSSQPKRGQQSHSSPEVSKNRLPIKPNDMNNHDNSEYLYNEYMSSPAIKNDCYASNQDPMKGRYSQKYPYEEPLQDGEYSSENHERNCACDFCNRRMSRRDHYRNCKCYECMRTKRPMDDQLSSYSEESQGLNLAYQKTEEYPVLVNEIENTISMRNKERVRKTMKQFELLSRQNKGLDKPIYDDDEEENTSSRLPCNKRTPFNRPQSNETNRQFCYDRSRSYQTRSECLSDKPTYSPTPFPRNRGYVEKVARYMEPAINDGTQKYPKFQSEYTNTKWQMDPRSGEWVKVYDGYDFENNYPPLPPTPSPMYRDYDYSKNQHCQNYYNSPSHRSASPIKHTMNKPCSCRNCIGNQSNSRY